MEPIIVENTLNTDAKTVWEAITQRTRMIQWFFDNIPDFKPEVGFETGFNVQAPSRDFYHFWKVVEVIPNKKISYTWRFKGITGESVSIFEIFEESSRSRLRITNIGLESFPKDIPEFTKESCLGGWNYFMGRLTDYLDNNG